MPWAVSGEGKTVRVRKNFEIVVCKRDNVRGVFVLFNVFDERKIMGW